MKKIIVFIFCCCLVLSNVSCQSKNITNKAVECNHQWANATCTEPKKCTLCGTTDGVAKGHVWKEATCVTYKTCSVCGENLTIIMENILMLMGFAHHVEKMKLK